jgi:hypothetical protein
MPSSDGAAAVEGVTVGAAAVMGMGWGGVVKKQSIG